MSYFALAWLLYGLHGVFSEKVLSWPEGIEPPTFSESTISGIVFPGVECCIITCSVNQKAAEKTSR